MKAVKVRVSLCVLEDAFGLPKSIKINRVTQSWDDEVGHQAWLLLESDEFPELKECDPLPQKIIQVTQDEFGQRTGIII